MFTIDRANQREIMR